MEKSHVISLLTATVRAGFTLSLFKTASDSSPCPGTQPPTAMALVTQGLMWSGACAAAAHSPPMPQVARSSLAVASGSNSTFSRTVWSEALFRAPTGVKLIFGMWLVSRKGIGRRRGHRSSSFIGWKFTSGMPAVGACPWKATIVMCADRTGGTAEADRGFRILEWASSALGGQKTLVKSASWATRQAWRTMVKELAPQSAEGDYLRPKSTVMARAGATLDPAAQHALYVGNTCPWCHRAQLVLTLRQVPEERVARVRLLDEPERASRGGWAFNPEKGVRDPVFNAADLREVYDKSAAKPGASGYVGRCTAPLLVDMSSKRAVSNDSEQLVRFLGGVQGAEVKPGLEIDLLPPHLEKEVSDTTQWTYKLLSNAVYRAGFGTSQEAFDRAVADVAEGLTKAEQLLTRSRFLCGDRISEADVMLLPCAVRFDAVYSNFFLRGSCGLWRERTSLRRWLGELWALPGVQASVDVAACRESYYRTLFPLNPSQIVPAMPPSDVDQLQQTPANSDVQVEDVFHLRAIEPR